MILKEKYSKEFLKERLEEYSGTYNDIIQEEEKHKISVQMTSGLYSDIVTSELNQLYHEYGLIRDQLNVYYNFRDKLKTIYEDFDRKRVVDIGAGIVPQLAREIAKESKEEIIAVDAIISEKNNKYSNLVLMRGIFDSNTTIENRDLLIGHESCDATMDIIKKACFYNIDFAIVLCDCLYVHDGINRLQGLKNYVENVRNISKNSNLGEVHFDYVGPKPLIYTNKKRK